MCPEREDAEPLPAPLVMLVWCLGVEQVSPLTPFYIPAGVSTRFIGQVHL